MRVRRHSCTSGRPSDLGLAAREDTSLHKPASVPAVPPPWALSRLCFSRTSAREAVAASPHALCPRPWSKAVVLLRKAPLDHLRRGRGDEDIACRAVDRRLLLQVSRDPRRQVPSHLPAALHFSPPDWPLRCLFKFFQFSAVSLKSCHAKRKLPFSLPCAVPGPFVGSATSSLI